MLKKIKFYFNCGRIENHGIKACDFTVNSFKDIDNKIVPFFSRYPLIGSKLWNLNDFNKVVKMMKNKEHLNKSGLDKIKIGMNTKRKINN